MYETTSVVCEDGIQRRVRTLPKRQKKQKREEDLPEEYKKFSQLYTKIAENRFAEELYFQSKNWTRKKILYVSKILEILKQHNIKDQELYILAHFEEQKHNREAIWPSWMASERGLKTYRTWVSQFPSKQQARELLQNLDLEELIFINHKKMLWYQSKGMPKLAVYRSKAGEFDLIYLATDQDFLDLLRDEPEVLSRAKKIEFENIRYQLLQDRTAHLEFLEIVRRIKCPRMEK